MFFKNKLIFEKTLYVVILISIIVTPDAFGDNHRSSPPFSLAPPFKNTSLKCKTHVFLIKNVLGVNWFLGEQSVYILGYTGFGLVVL